MKLLAALALVLSCVGLALATSGVDISQAASQADFACMKNSGMQFVVIRCYQSVGRVDPNCASSVKNARAGGIAYVDVYLFPCHSCGNPAGQMDALVNYIKANGLNVGMIWLDIEGPGTYWGSSQSANADFIGTLISSGNASGHKLGIYTSASQWNPIVGGWTGGKDLPLWYAHYDGAANFNDFSAFGGWSKPTIKQFADGPALCGVGADRNWYP